MATLDGDDLTAIRAQIDAALAAVGVTSTRMGYLDTALSAVSDNLESLVNGVQVSVDALTALVSESNTVTEIDSQTIKLNVGSTKAKTHFVTGNLAGKTLKLCVDYPAGSPLLEISATGANGSFSFTPSSSLVAAVKTFPAALREPSDGNNVLWKGNIEVAYAADAE